MVDTVVCQCHRLPPCDVLPSSVHIPPLRLSIWHKGFDVTVMYQSPSHRSTHSRPNARVRSIPSAANGRQTTPVIPPMTRPNASSSYPSGPVHSPAIIQVDRGNYQRPSPVIRAPVLPAEEYVTLPAISSHPVTFQPGAPPRELHDNQPYMYPTSPPVPQNGPQRTPVILPMTTPNASSSYPSGPVHSPAIIEVNRENYRQSSPVFRVPVLPAEDYDTLPAISSHPVTFQPGSPPRELHDNQPYMYPTSTQLPQNGATYDFPYASPPVWGTQREAQTGPAYNSYIPRPQPQSYYYVHSQPEVDPVIVPPPYVLEELSKGPYQSRIRFLTDNYGLPKPHRPSIICNCADRVARLIYIHCLVHIPEMYFSRVFKLFNCPARTGSFLPIPNAMQVDGLSSTLSPVYILLDDWDPFVETVSGEWEALNILSGLEIGAILTLLQIGGVSDNIVSRTAAFLALIASLWSVIFGCIYVVRFKTMKTREKAKRWAKQVYATKTNIFWNVWVMLALPAVWLGWSITALCIAVLSMMWNTTSGNGPAPALPHLELASSITVSAFFALGLVYLVCVVCTFQSWREDHVSWFQLFMNPPKPPLPIHYARAEQAKY
ncbi:hypothetical protein BD410DRAFT_306341 [Rickenella mellea]|uniref:Uncharacterized protein n=1 Tax=Rickenella mellea TaxID=50990 RepID=A0A4Y7Q214_9AGAM|nr:hypothetical protein BD410DRAFT_306341 [Rickenella mellea]